jgi:hypothetical protein
VIQEDTELVPITQKVEVAMKKFKNNNKDPRTDSIPAELLKNTGLECSKYKNFWSKYGSMKQPLRMESMHHISYT